MARFYLTAVNSRGNTVRAAGSSRGRDCDLGVEVIASVDAGKDAFRIWVTGGTNDASHEEFLACVTRREDGTLRIEDGSYPNALRDNGYDLAELRPGRRASAILFP